MEFILICSLRSQLSAGPIHFINHISFLFENEKWNWWLIEMKGQRPQAAYKSNWILFLWWVMPAAGGMALREEERTIQFDLMERGEQPSQSKSFNPIKSTFTFVDLMDEWIGLEWNQSIFFLWFLWFVGYGRQQAANAPQREENNQRKKWRLMKWKRKREEMVYSSFSSIQSNKLIDCAAACAVMGCRRPLHFFISFSSLIKLNNEERESCESWWKRNEGKWTGLETHNQPPVN